MGQTTVHKYVCKAPVFKGSVGLCLLLWIGSFVILPVLIIAVIFSAFFGKKGRFKAICALRRYLFMLGNCQNGNNDPNIVLFSQ